jgi:tetrapyrrole methylase family protein/MazG family protein
VSPRKAVPTRKRARTGRKAARGPEPRTKRSRPAGRSGALFEDLVALQARLRAPNGCPWDREQTHESLRTFLVEETYEVLEALDSGDARKFAGELGDLLLQIVFHARLAEEAGRFTVSDVIRGVHDKMVRRHPHVFGKVKARSSSDVLKNWEQLKAEERQADAGHAPAAEAASILDGVPRTLPALLEAHQLTRRAANIGFDWDRAEGLFEKLAEETAELRGALDAGASGRRRAAAKRPSPAVEEEVGDLLFVAVNLARFLGLDAEIALKKANRKFIARFQWMEREAGRGGRKLAEVSREQMERMWEASKEHR